MGNNRMVVNKNGTVEQVTHYYPYGGVIGDISTNENVQNYKFEGKELDRTFGLDNYDIHARQYFSMMPTWDRIDPLAEKFYGISPYSYCGGDPVNFGDYNGEDATVSVYGDTITISANIVLTGSQASQELADVYQQGIDETWGTMKSVEINGKKYSIVWDVNVSVDKSIDINNKNQLKRDGKTNYLEVGEFGYSSINSDGFTGKLRSEGREGMPLAWDNPIGHEFGHLMGLEDKYITRGDKRDKTVNIIGDYATPISEEWGGTIMGSKAGNGVIRNKFNEMGNVLETATHLSTISGGWPIKIGFSNIRERRYRTRSGKVVIK